MSGWRASRVAYDDVLGVADALQCPEPMAWALVRRGLGDPHAAREFLRADGPLGPPEAMDGVGAAADRLAVAVRRGERVVVHGDYDCDGIASTALMLAGLEARGGRVRSVLPSRFDDGYGLSTATVERLADEGCDLLVCVDCGTSSVEEIARGGELGIETIVCDHHLAGGRRPEAILVNPALGPSADDLPAAAGVVFAVVRALAARLDGEGLAPGAEEGIDLVALATVADAVPLVGENRRLVARGLASLRARPRPGIVALCRAAGSDPRAMSARGLGFTLAPAINAAGRLTHADEALALLRVTTVEEGLPLAQRLWELNMERRDVERRIVDEAIAMVEAEPPERRAADAIVVAGDGWHQGVVGIVASRLVDRFERPAVVIARDGEAARGSGRSVPGVDLHGLVAESADHLTRWGGHAAAIGLELPSSAIGPFGDALRGAARGARRAIQRAAVRDVDAVVGAGDLTLPVAEALEQLAPFGRGNPQVSLAVPGARVGDLSRVGDGEHLRLRLHSGGAHAGAIAFRWGRRADELDPSARYDAVVRLGVDRFQGLVGPKVEMDRLDRRSQAEVPFEDGSVDLRALLERERGSEPAPLAAPGPPRAVHDRRGQGAVLPVLAALAGADRGVAAVVADAGRRRAALQAALDAQRLGVAAVVVADGADDPADLEDAAGRGGVLALVEAAALARTAIPEGVHVVVVDPPADPAADAWLRARAAGRHLHLVYGPQEVEFARQCATAEWELRPAATAAWRALADGGLVPWTPELWARLRGAGAEGPPRAQARALAALAEIGLLELDDGGLRAIPPEGARDLAEAPRYRAGQERLAASLRFLELAPTLGFDVRAAPLAAVAEG